MDRETQQSLEERVKAARIRAAKSLRLTKAKVVVIGSLRKAKGQTEVTMHVDPSHKGRRKSQPPTGT